MLEEADNLISGGRIRKWQQENKNDGTSGNPGLGVSDSN